MLRRMTRGAAGRQAAARVLEAARNRLEVATAVARERVLEVYVEKALEMVELAAGRLDHSRVLEIYSRLHGLTEELEQLVRTRTLAALGEQAAAPKPSEVVAEEAPAEERSWLLSVLGERFRPRVQNELRLWMELHSGRTQVALIEAHVENALRFIEILAPDMSYSEAIEVYVDAIPLPPALASMVQFYALERLSRDHLPSRFWRGRSRPVGTKADDASAGTKGGHDSAASRPWPMRRGRTA